MKSLTAIVQEIVAHRARRETATMTPSLHLRRDLNLRPLDLALVALDLEEVVDVEVPCHAVANASTVGELVASLTRAVVRARTAQHAESAARYFTAAHEES
jgi:acyl carrier protein